jgi:hypothetical protein
MCLRAHCRYRGNRAFRSNLLPPQSRYGVAARYCTAKVFPLNPLRRAAVDAASQRPAGCARRNYASRACGAAAIQTINHHP